MTNTPITHQDFYVYVLFREDGITPFYIGKGRGERIYVHERQAHRFTSHKDRIIQTMLARGILSIPKAKLIERLTDSEAKQIEIDLIHLIGRWPTGPLANLTSGGDGVAALSQEAKIKQSAANVSSWRNPLVRKKRCEGMKAVWTEEKRATHSAKLRNKSPEVRARISAGRKAAWQRPEVIEKARIAYSNPISRAAKSIAMKRNWADPETRKMRSEASRIAQSSPEYRAKRSLIAKAMWQKRKAQYALPSPKLIES